MGGKWDELFAEPMPVEPEPWEEELDGTTLDGLQQLVRWQKELLSAVATGTSISQKEDEYSSRRVKLRRAYKKLDAENPFPWSDLYSFWAYISDWSTYAQRRSQLTELMDNALDELDAIEEKAIATEEIPTWDLPLDDSWQPLAERALDLKTEYETAETLDDLQDVGRRARQVIIEAVKVAWDEGMVPEGEDAPKADDAAKKLDHILAAKIPGSSSSRLRKFIRSALVLGQETTHSENQEGLEAMASAMGAAMAVRLLQELDRTEAPGMEAEAS
jgi:hypothetical protein